LTSNSIRADAGAVSGAARPVHERRPLAARRRGALAELERLLGPNVSFFVDALVNMHPATGELCPGRGATLGRAQRLLIRQRPRAARQQKSRAPASGKRDRDAGGQHTGARPPDLPLYGSGALPPGRSQAAAIVAPGLEQALAARGSPRRPGRATGVNNCKGCNKRRSRKYQNHPLLKP